MTPQELKVLQNVWIHAMGSYCLGIVTRVGRKTVTVMYISGAGKTRTKIVNPATVLRTLPDGYVITNVKPYVEGEPIPAGTRQTKE